MEIRRNMINGMMEHPRSYNPYRQATGDDDNDPTNGGGGGATGAVPTAASAVISPILPNVIANNDAGAWNPLRPHKTGKTFEEKFNDEFKAIEERRRTRNSFGNIWNQQPDMKVDFWNKKTRSMRDDALNGAASREAKEKIAANNIRMQQGQGKILSQGQQQQANAMSQAQMTPEQLMRMQSRGALSTGSNLGNLYAQNSGQNAGVMGQEGQRKFGLTQKMNDMYQQNQSWNLQQADNVWRKRMEAVSAKESGSAMGGS